MTIYRGRGRPPNSEPGTPLLDRDWSARVTAAVAEMPEGDEERAALEAYLGDDRAFLLFENRTLQLSMTGFESISSDAFWNGIELKKGRTRLVLEPWGVDVSEASRTLFVRLFVRRHPGMIGFFEWRESKRYDALFPEEDAAMKAFRGSGGRAAARRKKAPPKRRKPRKPRGETP